MGVVQHIFNALSRWLWLVICVFLIQPGWASYNSVQKYEYLGNYNYEFIVPASVNEINEMYNHKIVAFFLKGFSEI